MRTIFLLGLSLFVFFACSDPVKSKTKNLGDSEFYASASLFDFQSHVGMEKSELAVWIGRDFEFVDKKIVDGVLDSVRLTTGGGESLIPPLSSRNDTQALIRDAVDPEPVELVFDASSMTASGWNRLDMEFPEPFRWRDMSGQKTGSVHFRADSFPVVTSVLFGQRVVEVFLSEPVEGDPTAMVVRDESGVDLPCVAEWGSNNMLIHAACDVELPATVAVKIAGDYLMADGHSLQAVAGGSFELVCRPADLPMTSGELRLWSASL